jgi:hypothetical protein
LMKPFPSAFHQEFALCTYRRTIAGTNRRLMKASTRSMQSCGLADWEEKKEGEGVLGMDMGIGMSMGVKVEVWLPLVPPSPPCEVVNRRGPNCGRLRGDGKNRVQKEWANFHFHFHFTLPMLQIPPLSCYLITPYPLYNIPLDRRQPSLLPLTRCATQTTSLSIKCHFIPHPSTSMYLYHL